MLNSINKQFEGGFWTAFVASAVVAALAFLLVRFSGKAMRKMAESGRFGAVNVAYTRRIVAVIIVLLAALLIFMQVKPLQSLSRSLLASSGVLAVVLGFAAQQAMANIVGGFFISVFKPVTIGDRITLVDQKILGVVEDISLRHTVIRTFENTRVIVPNSVMNSAIIENAHFLDARVCRFLDIGVSYESDLDRAMAIIAQEVRSHRDFLDNRTDGEKADGVPEVVVRVIALAESSVNLRAAVWATDAGTAYAMLCDLLYTVKKRFDAEGIVIPYPHRTVILSKPQ